MNIFVGNLAFEAKEADVYKLFVPFGKVASISIVMDKNGKNSRGFAFLEMFDELEAKAAIEALHGKELLGRAINVEPAKSQGPREERTEGDSPKDREPKFEARGKPRFNKRPGYKAGRRSLSFMKKRAAAGETAPLPERKFKENPMRWRKKKPWEHKEKQQEPWRRAEAGDKPWKKTEAGAKPWNRAEAGGVKPWKRAEAGDKPWKKTEAGAKPWKRAEGSAKHWKKGRGEFRPRRKAE